MVYCVDVPARTREVIAQFLRLRAEKGHLVPAKLARALGVKPSALNPVIKGKRPFPMGRLDETAAFFGWDAVTLIQQAREEVATAETTTDEDRRLRILEFLQPVPLKHRNGHDTGDGEH